MSTDIPAALPAPKDVLAMAQDCGLLMDGGTSCYRENADISDAVVALVHEALARWGRLPAAPAAPEVGSAAALATWLRDHSGQCVELGQPDWAHMADRAADTLEAFCLGGWIVPTVEDAPAAPEVGEVREVREVREVVEWLEEEAEAYSQTFGTSLASVNLARAATLLQQLSAPAPVVVPVAVAERLPGEGDCAPWPDEPEATPWCWWGKAIDGGWEWVQLNAALGVGEDIWRRWIAGGGWTHWLPAHAIPLPQIGEGEA